MFWSLSNATYTAISSARLRIKKGGGKMRITQEKMDAIAVLMDDETREKVHHELAPCEPIEFLKRYCELEPSFEAVLKDEFSIEI